jgi:hypothetical protein
MQKTKSKNGDWISSISLDKLVGYRGYIKTQKYLFRDCVI